MSKTAVDAKRGTFFWVDPRKLTIIGLDVAENGTDPLSDPERIKLPIDPALVANIEALGVIEAIKARKVGDQLIVADGRRRTLHARVVAEKAEKAGLEPLLVKVILVDGDQTKLVGIKESSNRFRVNDDVFATARAVRRHVDQGLSLDDIATIYGVSDQTIRNWLSTEQLVPEVREAVVGGEIPATAALQLANLTPDEQREELAGIKEDKEAGRKPTVANVQERVAKRQGKEGPVGVTPKMRIQKMGDILRATAQLPKAELTKEKLLEVLNKLSRHACGKGFDKLGEED